MGYYSDTCSGPGSRRAGRGLGGPGGLNVEGTYMLYTGGCSLQLELPSFDLHALETAENSTR